MCFKLEIILQLERKVYIVAIIMAHSTMRGHKAMLWSICPSFAMWLYSMPRSNCHRWGAYQFAAR